MRITQTQFTLEGQSTAIEGKQWANLRFQLEGPDKHRRSVVLKVMTSSDPDASLNDLYECSREEALECLKSLLDLTSQNSLLDLATQAAGNADTGGGGGNIASSRTQG